MKKSNQEAQSLLIKEQVIQAARQFFLNQDFHEIFTPVLNHGLPLEPNLYSFSTKWQYLDQQQNLYLSTSPEASLKKMLTLGLEKVFSISPSFRNLEPSDADHNPEFLMLEWYQTNADYEQIMQDVQELVIFVYQKLNQSSKRSASMLIDFQGDQINLQTPWNKVSLADLFEQEVGQPFTDFLSLTAMKKLAKKYNFLTTNATWEQLFNQFFIEKIEPILGNQPVFLTDYPSQISPLCLPKKDRPELAERFELFIAGYEVGNGNTEQTDSKLLNKIFLQEKQYREANNLPTHEIDQEFLNSLEKLHQTQKKYAGMGLGIDRLAMIFSNVDEIKKINPFVLRG